MRGLTPLECRMLTEIVEAEQWECIGVRDETSAAEIAALDDLIEQGRTIRAPCLCHGVSRSSISHSGREALRLWPLVKAAMEAR